MTEFTYHRIFEIEKHQPWDDSGVGEITKRDIRFIRARLAPDGGRSRYSRTSYSMFATDRRIDSLELQIRPLDDEEFEEVCRAWGSPAYTFELDFRDETTPDAVLFEVHVKPSRFQTYLDFINGPNPKSALFSVGLVSGFYAEWSHGISTDKVKVLANKEDQKLVVPEGCDIDPAVLGDVGHFSLHLQSSLPLTSTDEQSGGDDEDDGLADTEDEGPPSPVALEPRHIAELAALFLKSQRTTNVALGVLTVLLLLIWLK